MKLYSRDGKIISFHPLNPEKVIKFDVSEDKNYLQQKRYVKSFIEYKSPIKEFFYPFVNFIYYALFTILSILIIIKIHFANPNHWTILFFSLQIFFIWYLYKRDRNRKEQQKKEAKIKII